MMTRAPTLQIGSGRVIRYPRHSTPSALLKDIGTTLKATWRNLARSRRRIAKDLEQIEQALMKGKAAARPAPKRATSAPRASAARSSKATRPTSSTKRTAKSGKVS